MAAGGWAGRGGVSAVPRSLTGIKIHRTPHHRRPVASPTAGEDSEPAPSGAGLAGAGASGCSPPGSSSLPACRRLRASLTPLLLTEGRLPALHRRAAGAALPPARWGPGPWKAPLGAVDGGNTSSLRRRPRAGQRHSPLWPAATAASAWPLWDPFPARGGHRSFHAWVAGADLHFACSAVPGEGPV